MQNLDNVSLDQVIQFLTIREFFATSQSCSFLNKKCLMYKSMKTPFFCHDEVFLEGRISKVKEL